MHYTHHICAGVPSHPVPSGGNTLLSLSLLTSRTTSCQLRRIDRGRNTLAHTAREGAVITRPAEMPSDPQTQAVWPAVDWEWPLLTFPCSLLTTSPSESWNVVKVVFTPQTNTLNDWMKLIVEWSLRNARCHSVCVSPVVISLYLLDHISIVFGFDIGFFW